MELYLHTRRSTLHRGGTPHGGVVSTRGADLHPAGYSPQSSVGCCSAEGGWGKGEMKPTTMGNRIRNCNGNQHTNGAGREGCSQAHAKDMR